jgi:hypothetical protein
MSADPRLIDGHDYRTGRPRSLSAREWRQEIELALGRGDGFLRIENGETFVHSRRDGLQFEIYGVIRRARGQRVTHALQALFSHEKSLPGDVTHELQLPGDCSHVNTDAPANHDSHLPGARAPGTAGPATYSHDSRLSTRGLRL